MGTWCPNCREEAEFLKDYLANNDVKDLEVIALAFEKYGADDERSRAVVRRYEENLNPPWPVLLAGPAHCQCSTKSSASPPCFSSTATIRLNEFTRVLTAQQPVSTRSLLAPLRNPLPS